MEMNATRDFTNTKNKIHQMTSHPGIHSSTLPRNDGLLFEPTLAERVKQRCRRRSTVNALADALPKIDQLIDMVPQSPKANMKRKAGPQKLVAYSSKRAEPSPASTATFESSMQTNRPADFSESFQPSEPVYDQPLLSTTPYDPSQETVPSIIANPNATSSIQVNPLFQSDKSSPQPNHSFNPLFDVSDSIGETEQRKPIDQPILPSSIAATNNTALQNGPSVSGDQRPINDTTFYETFVQRMMKSLTSKADSKTPNIGRRQARRIRALLERASPATNTEMLFLTGSEAAARLSSGVFHNGPILTEDQQPMPLQNIAEFLEEFYDDEALVAVQHPATKLNSKTHSVKEVSMVEVKKRFSKPSAGRPWNCLELATHVEDGLRPSFLNQEDARLLTKLKVPGSDEHVGRRQYPKGYKEVEKWALLAQAGALTEPHQDSHGYSTYITVNQGQLGFGWLSYPSAEDRAAWQKEPHSFLSDRFRYVVQKPGQTVYFPAGTVHFVFRSPSGGDTLAFGGHILRCSNLTHWVKTLHEERANTQITNEDTTTSAPGYLNRVDKFVRNALASGKAEKWGGVGQINEFLRLKEEYLKDD